jgi:translation elongation factor EF-Tu-like GTPase
MSFFYPAGRLRAGRVHAAITGAALADLAVLVDGGFPGGLWDQREHCLLGLPSGQPTD